MKPALTTTNEFKLRPYRVRLLIAYEGTNYCGWQTQLVHINKQSVQKILENTLSKIYKEPIRCIASGRTDAGVHAMGQNVHFDLTNDPRRFSILKALRTLLPQAISVRKAWLVPKDFSVVTSARAKTYRYYIANANVPSAFYWRHRYWYPHSLDLELLQEYAKQLIGAHDFKSFQTASGRAPKRSLRKIYRAQWTQLTKDLFVFEITGNGFLRHMVRNLVATQLNLLKQQQPATEIRRILSLKNRNFIGRAAPANGLFLTKVHYPKSILANCQPIE